MSSGIDSMFPDRIHPSLKLTRRGFLIGVGATGAGLVAGISLAQEPGGTSGGDNSRSLPDDPDVWFEITPENKVLFITPKIEMGQGIHTSMAQVAADELGASWDQVIAIQGNSIRGARDGFGTVGSYSLETSYMPIRRAAAMLREMLRREAGRRLGIDTAELVVVEGRIQYHDIPGNGLSFGEIVQGVSDWPEPTYEPVLKEKSQFRFIGQSIPRLDVPGKLRGQSLYGYDQQAEDMLFGAVARPPKFSATMVSVGAGSAEEMPGVEQIVTDIDTGFAGVVARTRKQARDAIAEMDFEWEQGHPWSHDEILDMLDVSDDAGTLAQDEGDALAALADPTLSAEYRTPLGAHAQLEPPAAIASVVDNHCDVIAATQVTFNCREAVAKALGWDEDQVVVTPSYVGGGFGRKDAIPVAPEAALLSRAVGRPVHIGWTREEEMAQAFFRPPTHHLMSGLVEEGRIFAVKHNVSSGEVLFGQFPEPVKQMMGIDPGARIDGSIAYDRVPHRRFSVHTKALPVPTGSWRSLGALANAFAVESFIDELAHTAGADPLEFRLAHTGETGNNLRRAAVLSELAQRVDYGASPPPGRALGIACTGSDRSVVALCLEVSIEDNGQIVVHKATEVIDPGLLVNPDGARAQAQGAITMGLSASLIEEIRIVDGAVEATNFHQYPLLTISQTPEFDISFIESGDAPLGLGEPPLVPVAAALGNAVYNLTGKRYRELPLTRERISGDA